MDLGLNNKVVVVSGSSKGIGRAIAFAFANEGANVCVTGRTDADVSKTAEELSGLFGGKIISYTGDLTNKGNVDECISSVLKQWGTIDVFVGNIGNGRAKPILDSDRNEWQRMLDINLLGSVEMAQRIVPVMQRKKRGSIIFIASIAGVEHINAPAAYSAAKAGLISYSKSLANALAADNIRVNTVAPGNITFPGSGWERIIKENPDTIKGYIENEVPLKRFGTPEEIADAVVFLASEKASFITGTCLVVDGGQCRRC